MTGVSADLLVRNGFTGELALTVESGKAAKFGDDLDDRWLIIEQYFKHFAVCRWAQPAIAGVLKLRKQHSIDLQTIQSIRVTTYHEATRLADPHPESTEDAQYSLPFSVVAALGDRQLGSAELSDQGLLHPLVLRLAGRVELVKVPSYSAHFPAERLARVRIKSADGLIIDSAEMQAPRGKEDPPSVEALREKFSWLASTSLSQEEATKFEGMIWQVEDLPDVSSLCHLLVQPPADDVR